MKTIRGLVLVLSLPLTVFAAEEAATDAKSETFGGPSGVTGEERANEDIRNAFRVDNRKIYLKPWYDWKARLKERSGLSFGINAQMVFAGVSDALGDEDNACLLYTSPSPRDATLSRMPSSA